MMREWSVQVSILSIPCKHLAPVSKVFSSPRIILSLHHILLISFVLSSPCCYKFNLILICLKLTKVNWQTEGIHVYSLIVSCK